MRRPATDLGAATWTELGGRPALVLLVPVGSCEQHGPHLPLDTDARIAAAVARDVAAGRADVVVAPVVAYGSSGEHQSFPGTLSVGTDALRSLLVELGRSAFPPPGADLPEPFRALVLVNGHGGNVEAVRGAVDVLAGEGRPVRGWWPRLPGGDAHAGRTETSLLLAIRPDLVRTERPAGATDPVVDLLPRMRDGGVAAVTSNGVLGDARGASAEEGRRLLADLVADLGAEIEALPGS
jgi:mycofactocin precursor peptide peptidase